MTDQNRNEFLAAARRYLFGSETGNASQTGTSFRKFC